MAETINLRAPRIRLRIKRLEALIEQSSARLAIARASLPQIILDDELRAATQAARDKERTKRLAEISIEQDKIIALRKTGLTYREIGKILGGISSTAVRMKFLRIARRRSGYNWSASERLMETWQREGKICRRLREDTSTSAR
jgi:hypothetical protein